MNSCFFILFWLNVYFFLLLQTIEWVPVSFPSLLVPYTFSFILLCIAFTSSSTLQPYSTISVSILIPVFWTLYLIGWLSLYHLVLFLELWSVLSFGLFFFSPILACLLHFEGWSLRYSPAWVNPHCCFVVLFWGEGSEREQCHLLSSRTAFSHFPHYP